MEIQLRGAKLVRTIPLVQKSTTSPRSSKELLLLIFTGSGAATGSQDTCIQQVLRPTVPDLARPIKEQMLVQNSLERLRNESILCQLLGISLFSNKTR